MSVDIFASRGNGGSGLSAALAGMQIDSKSSPPSQQLGELASLVSSASNPSKRTPNTFRVAGDADLQPSRDAIALATITDEERELKQKGLPFEVRSTLGKGVTFAARNAALAFNGVSSTAGIANKVAASRAVAGFNDGIGVGIDEGKLPYQETISLLDAITDQLRQQNYRRAETTQGFENLSYDRPNPITPVQVSALVPGFFSSGKLSERVGKSNDTSTIDGQVGYPSDDNLWKFVADNVDDIVVCANIIHQYDTKYNDIGGGDNLVAVLAAYVIINNMAPTKLWLEDAKKTISVLSTAAGFKSNIWSEIRDKDDDAGLQIAKAIASSNAIDTKLGKYNAIDQSNEANAFAKVFKQMQESSTKIVVLVAKLMDITDHSNLDSVRIKADLLLELARLHKLSPNEGLQACILKSWQVQFDNFIGRVMLDATSSGKLKAVMTWLVSTPTDTLSQVKAMKDIIKSWKDGKVPPEVYLLMLCFILDSKYADGISDEKKQMFRKLINGLNVPLVRAYYYMTM